MTILNTFRKGRVVGNRETAVTLKMMLVPVRVPWWLWLNILSLDAPLVALVWQDFLGRCYPATLLLPARAALGLTVWAIYLADRLLDVRYPALGPEMPRHRFYRHNSRFAKVLLLIVVCADAMVALFLLRPVVFREGILVAAAVGFYLWIFPLNGVSGSRKQISAAVLFTVGVFLVAWIGTGASHSLLIGPALSFCGLCLCNLVLIESWEDRPKSNRAWTWIFGFAFLILCSGQSNWYLAMALSAAGLALLALSGQRLCGDVRRVLADAVLLTPLFWLLR